MKPYILLTLCACMIAGDLAAAGEKHTAYVMAYFRSRREKQGEQLYYATSRDGLNWTALNNGKPVFSPECRLRDPYLQRVNGTFHLVHTKGINYPHIFHWESKDLINWEGGEVHVMPGRHRSWAPEFIYCPKEKVFYVFWASDHDGHNTMHFQKTKDWKENDSIYDIEKSMSVCNMSGNKRLVADATPKKICLSLGCDNSIRISRS